jgi:paraquat-inducible protein A
MRAIDRSLASCHTCGLLLQLTPGKHASCPRCGDAVHLRKTNSIRNTWALLLAAIAMYLPANVLPIMTVTSLGNTQSDTIMSGVIYFLLLSVQRKSPLRKNQRTRLYRITELVGRWSMVDVFVVALMAALVQVGELATIQPAMGAVAFASVVILTMLAAMAFDPRLIWDNHGVHDGNT